MSLDIRYEEHFQDRHNAPGNTEVDAMLQTIGVNSVDELIDQTVPSGIRVDRVLNLPEPKSEAHFLRDFKKSISRNKVYDTFIGMGYYNTHVPTVIQRNVLENPGWYTAYTPYQAEIAQGRLEALINFQTTVIDLTGMELANASLLDEGTAAAEAMAMLAGSRKGAKKSANTFFVDINCFPQTIDVLTTRAKSIGLVLDVAELSSLDLTRDDIYGVFIQNPDGNGEIRDYTDLTSSAHDNQVFVCMAADLLSLVVVKSPGEMGVDVVVGTTQRFGVPMGMGGPHAGYFATSDKYKRQLPGRIIGASLDSNGNNAYRMALQTREQHIRREKATSNICTAQVLLGVMAGMYAVYHGPKGLRKIAERTHGLAKILSHNLKEFGLVQTNKDFFDTIKVAVPTNIDIAAVKEEAESQECNFRYFEDGHIGIALDETTRIETVETIVGIFANVLGKAIVMDSKDTSIDWTAGLQRTTDFLTHEVFNSFQAEHEMLRYIKRLENKDLSLVHSMISLGSCTMKLNATTEMIPLSWAEVGGIHPFVPADQVTGYYDLFAELEDWLTEITGFAATSLQPNSGAQGEYAGLMVIRAYHESRGEGHRNVTLIPTSAHGTNPASAVMAGTKVVLVACDDKGNIDVADLQAKAEEHKENLFSLMVTYPSTHGVFEESIVRICEIIHEYGGQVYMDGANMNAQVGLTSPGFIGADVCHLNLHKTFCIPHGGGGPGVGPICVAEQLKQFLPGNPVVKTGGENAITAISSAPWGSASILPIPYAYIAMMGSTGLTNATKLAILNANYMKTRLEKHYPILYTGSNGRCAHEMIVDCRGFKADGVEVEDIAKRLMDYGFHAPTVSFPVPGTMMIEPTESESKMELDRFCDALIAIRAEIDAVISGKVDPINNLLKNAPHTVGVISSDDWDRPYTRQQAAYPLDFVKENKFWPSVGRVDNAHGDRNLVCACLPIEAYA